MNLKEKRAAELAAAQAIVDGAKAAVRGMTKDEQETVEGHLKSVEQLDQQIKSAEADQSRLSRLAALTPEAQSGAKADEAPSQAASLGEHFIKSVGDKLAAVKGVQGASLSAPEFKAATDTHVVGSVFQNPVLTQFDRTVIQGNRPRLTIADLLGSGTISGNAISYFVEGALEGGFTTVAEGAAKPQLHIVDPTLVTDSLKKIAGWIKLSDEMIEDLDFFVSEINGRLLYELAKFEEAQLLSGNGTGSNVLGLLNRSGIQTEARGTVASGDTMADALFRAMTKVSTGSGLDADGIVVNPADYQSLRLQRDANGQYYGGGFFAGEYGNGTLTAQPPLWGLRTVVTPSVPAGTALVANFSQAATVYRKGGVRVESTNSHASDFTSNLVTVRAEERVALAMRRPAAFVKVTTTAAP